MKSLHNSTGACDPTRAPLVAANLAGSQEQFRAVVRAGESYWLRIVESDGQTVDAYTLNIDGPLSSLSDVDGDGLPDRWESEPILFFLATLRSILIFLPWERIPYERTYS